MPICLLLFVGLLMVSAHAETRDQVALRLRTLESVSAPSLPVGFAFVDERVEQEHNLSFAPVRNGLLDSLRAHHCIVNDSGFSSALESVDFTLRISYFGTYRSMTGKWGVRAAGFIETNSRSAERSGERFSITFDRLIGGKGELRKGRWENRLVAEVVNRTLEKVQEILKRESTAYKEVIVLGSTPEDKDRPASENQARAVWDALRNGCEKAWGLRIEAKTRVQDIVDINDDVLKSCGCRVLSYEVLPQYSTSTSDGYRCVMVRAITQEK